jgi:hypothetical protein
VAVTIQDVLPGSPAARRRIRPGETLLSINGHAIEDVLDYRFYMLDSTLQMAVSDGKKTRILRLHKGEDEDPGLLFETYLMDKQRSCRNKCIFCFIDQLPPGLRDSLYFKDDDSRLSFLFGNYITLTNLSEHEISRILAMHISPINISVHTTNPELRARMMGNRFAGESLAVLRRFAGAGLAINCQLVLVPGWNDGDELSRTMADLAALAPSVKSVAAVPVGLTKYREGLTPLRLFTPEEARDVVERMEAMGDRLLEQTGSRLFYPSDEFYSKAGLPIPPTGFYGEMAQLENGVGMVALLREQFREALAAETRTPKGSRLLLATGVLAAPYIRELVDEAKEKWHNLQVEVVAVENRFFGETITVTGLLTGRDIREQLAGRDADILLLSRDTLRQEGDCFLDDGTPVQLGEALSMQVHVLDVDGAALLEGLLD